MLIHMYVCDISVRTKVYIYIYYVYISTDAARTIIGFPRRRRYQYVRARRQTAFEQILRYQILDTCVVVLGHSTSKLARDVFRSLTLLDYTVLNIFNPPCIEVTPPSPRTGRGRYKDEEFEEG